jgi:hypothetical protein
MEFGVLEKIDLRTGWKTEDTEFTPWLAQEENIKLLGNAINIELEVEQQEQNVGIFRADILCKNTADNTWVVIENQIERTDHKHLGQLITYASGLSAVTIVWIAAKFTDEHRAALDWLNECTDENLNFFGIEIELWRIGDSAIAPKFNVVCKPNDWTRTVAKEAKKIESGTLTETKQLQYEFWSKLQEYMQENSKIVKARKPSPQHWMDFAVGKTGFRMSAIMNSETHKLAIWFTTYGDDAKPNFHALHDLKSEIEERVGFSFEWREMPDKLSSNIVIEKPVSDVFCTEQWNEYASWMNETMNTIYKVFNPIIRSLGTSRG